MKIVVLACVVGLAAGCRPIPPEHDPFTTEDRSELGFPVLSLLWKFPLSDEMRTSKPQEFAGAALYGQTLIVGSRAGMLYSMSTRDGTIKWRSPVGAISASPVIDVLKGRIYVGTDDGSLVCVRAADGSEIWRYVSRGPVLQPPVLSDGLVLFSNEASQVYALDADTGKYRWQHKGEEADEYTLRGHAGVAVDGDLVFTGFANGSMVALRKSTGSVAWLTSLRGEAERFVDVDSTPVVSGERVFVTSSGGGVYALDKTSGSIVWRLAITGAGGLTVDGRRVYVVAADEGVYALDFAGNIIWRQGMRGAGEPVTPVISGSYVIYGSSEEGMFIADKRTGRVYQYFNPGDGVSAQPTIEPGGDRLYLLSNRDVLYAMNVRR